MAENLISEDIANYLKLQAEKLKSTQALVDRKESLQIFIDSVTDVQFKINLLKLKDVQLGLLAGSSKYTRVYEATANGEVVAMKQYNPDKCAWALNEKRCLMKLDHSAFLKVLYSFAEKDVFILTELCIGDLWFNVNDVTPGNQTRFAIQMLQGMEHMHSRGIIHRDIRPENILLTSSNNIKITDFKWAIVLKEGEESRTGLLPISSLWYSPLESLKNKVFSRKSDMFSVGCVIYEMERQSPLLAPRVLSKRDPSTAIYAQEYGRPKETFDKTKWIYVSGGGKQGCIREPIAERIRKIEKFQQLVIRLCNVDPKLRLLASEALKLDEVLNMREQADGSVYDNSAEMVIKDGGKKYRDTIAQQPFTLYNKKNKMNMPLSLSLVNFRYQHKDVVLTLLDDVQTTVENLVAAVDEKEKTDKIQSHALDELNSKYQSKPANSSALDRAPNCSDAKSTSHNESPPIKSILLNKPTKKRGRPKKQQQNEEIPEPKKIKVAKDVLFLAKQKLVAQNVPANKDPVILFEKAKCSPKDSPQNKKKLPRNSTSRSHSRSRSSSSPTRSHSNFSSNSDSSLAKSSSSDTSTFSAPDRFPCRKKHCKREFDTHKKRSKHEKKHKISMYCTHCGKGFSLEDKLHKHIKKRHSQSKIRMQKKKNSPKKPLKIKRKEA